MATLENDVKGRYSSQILVNASNPQSSGSTSIDDTRLSYAATDVKAEFTKRGMTYSESTATHVATAVPGVFARLLILTGQGGQAEWDMFLSDLDLLRETDARDRILPQTDSALTPTTDTAGDKPWADRSQFGQMIPDSPARDSTTDGNVGTTTD